MLFFYSVLFKSIEFAWKNSKTWSCVSRLPGITVSPFNPVSQSACWGLSLTLCLSARAFSDGLDIPVACFRLSEQTALCSSTPVYGGPKWQRSEIFLRVSLSPLLWEEAPCLWINTDFPALWLSVCLLAHLYAAKIYPKNRKRIKSL